MFICGIFSLVVIYVRLGIGFWKWALRIHFVSFSFTVSCSVTYVSAIYELSFIIELHLIFFSFCEELPLKFGKYLENNNNKNWNIERITFGI